MRVLSFGGESKDFARIVHALRDKDHIFAAGSAGRYLLLSKKAHRGYYEQLVSRIPFALSEISTMRSIKEQQN